MKPIKMLTNKLKEKRSLNTFVSGATSLAGCISDFPYKFDRDRILSQIMSDEDAIYNDWQVVGNDLLTSIYIFCDNHNIKRPSLSGERNE